MVRLHKKFVTFKTYLISTGQATESDFRTYNSLEVSPENREEAKETHKEAIFAIGEDIAQKISDGELSEEGRIRERMKELRAEV